MSWRPSGSPSIRGLCFNSHPVPLLIQTSLGLTLRSTRFFRLLNLNFTTMASVQRANVLSPSSELSYSMLSSAISILDDTSSDGGDVIYDISDDEDFVLIPHARIPQQETASIEYAMFRLDITTPEPEPVTSTTLSKYHKVIDPKGRRPTGAPPKRGGKPKLASGAPAGPKHSRRKRGKRDVASSPATSPERELTEEALFFDYDSKYALVVESDAESEYALMKYEGAKSFITS